MALWPRHRRRRVTSAATAGGPEVRRNVKTFIHKLDDFGVVVEEQPAR